MNIKLVFLVFVVVFSIPAISEEIIHNDVRYHVDSNVKKENEDLIKLILTTDSMDKGERQYWFDIMPSMTKKQIDKLYGILDTERKKLEQLEMKYQNEIKALNEKHLMEWKDFQKKDTAKKMAERIKDNDINVDDMLYVSFKNDEIPRVRISPLDSSNINSPYIPDDSDNLSRYEHMVMVEFGKIISKNSSAYKGLYGAELFQGYLEKILNSAIELNDTGTLALLYEGELIDRDSIAKASYLAKNDFEALSAQYEKGLSNGDWKKSTFHKLLNLTKWRRHENCGEICNRTLRRFLEQMNEEDWPFKIDNIRGYFTAELILLDVVSYLNRDIIDGSLRNKISLFIENYRSRGEAYYKKNKVWYMQLNNAYFSGQIRPLYDSMLSKYVNLVDFNSVEGDFLEVSTYLAFDLIKNSKESEALQLLENSKGLGDSMYSSAYKYLEKDLVDYLIKVALAPHKYKKGHIALGTYRVEGSKKEFRPFGKKYAIVIGVSDYKELKSEQSVSGTSLVDLKYSDNDAMEFESFLRNPERSGGGWEIYSFIDNQAKILDVRKTIDSVLTNAQENDLIYVFFSGHARLNPNNNAEVYLLTHDFNPKDPYSGIPYDWLISTVNRTKAKHLVAFVDACRSGVIKNSKGESFVDQNLLNNVLSHSKTKVIFTSGSGSQISYEDDELKQGVFTHFLIKGLNGESDDINEDGFVNLNELEEYTSSHVSDYTSSHSDITYQRPRVSNLDPTFSVQFPLSIR
ncbi:MAG: hypothetical protein EP322_00530 [Bacteroidetes bacterium]|nr:MAG: hypothetical protein EP322_00530 [Bacteroidota bacterium]